MNEFFSDFVVLEVAGAVYSVGCGVVCGYAQRQKAYARTYIRRYLQHQL